MYAWMIGCSTHGISGELLAKTKDSLALMNHLTQGDLVDGDYYSTRPLISRLPSRGTFVICKTLNRNKTYGS